MDLTDRPLATELSSGLVTRRPAHCTRYRGFHGTDRIRGQRHWVDTERQNPYRVYRVDGRTQLARRPVAHVQLFSPARCPEPVDSAALSRRSAVQTHHRSEQLRGGQSERRSPPSGHRAAGRPHGSVGRRRRGGDRSRCRAARAGQPRTCRVGGRSTAVRGRRRWKARNLEGDARRKHSGGRRPRSPRACGYQRWPHDCVGVVRRQVCRTRRESHESAIGTHGRCQAVSANGFYSASAYARASSDAGCLVVHKDILPPVRIVRHRRMRCPMR